MKKVGDVIPEHFRDCGSSLGLQYKYIFAHDLVDWIIWHRETGEVVYVETEPNRWVAETKVLRQCYILNGIDPDVIDPQVIIDIDNTP